MKSSATIILTVLNWLYLQSKIETESCGRMPVEFKNVDNATYIIGGMFPVHYYSSNAKGYLYNNPGLMWIEAMQFALSEINNSTTLLPGVKLGFKIYDSCNTINIAVEAALRLTQGFKDFRSNETCPCGRTMKPAIALVGDAASATTTRVAAVLSASRTTQISYSSTSTDLSAKHLYPSFLRTIPPDNFQAILITDLMRRFKWKYVNVVACDDSYGRVGVNELLPRFKKFNICVAINEVYDVKNDINQTYTNQVIQKLIDEKEATVIVLWCQRPEAVKVLEAAQALKLYHRTWIATEAYGNSSSIYKTHPNVVKGMFGIIPAQLSYQPFENHLKSVTPYQQHGNPWLHEYWTTKKNCSRNGSTYNCEKQDTDLTDLPTNKYVNVIDAVYAIAYGLQNYLNNYKHQTNKAVEADELLEYVKNVTFIGKSNADVSFNHLGDPGDATYSLTNVKYDAVRKTLSHHEVGMWNYKTRNITFTDSNLQFANDSSEVPSSSCAEVCLPGYKGLTFGDRPCCWKCVRCPPMTVQPNYGQLVCTECLNSKLPNKNQTECIQPELQKLKTNDANGILLIFFTVVGYIVILTSTCIFYKNRNTPIVKASNTNLSLLQLFSMLCILTLPALIFNSDATEELCGVRLFYFVCFYTIAVSVTFTKADRLLRIFKASKSGILAKRSIVRGNGVQFVTVLVLTIIALLLCTVIYVPFRPNIEKIVHYVGDEIHVTKYCSGYYDSILFILIGYIAMIALICGVYAFKARKLPETYNEARYTSFAMFTFLLIWMMFVPLYFSTASKINQLSIWCFISFAAVVVIYTTMYLPKLLIILFKPKENTAERFREKLKFRTNIDVNTSHHTTEPTILTDNNKNNRESKYIVNEH